MARLALPGLDLNIKGQKNTIHRPERLPICEGFRNEGPFWASIHSLLSGFEKRFARDANGP